MKKFLLIFFIIILSCHWAKAQYVTIPDTDFRIFLQQKYPSCFNSSGMMDTTCSAIVNEDTLALPYPQYPFYTQIHDITGIQYFKSLVYLWCYRNSLTSLPALPNSLVDLNLYGNQFTQLPALPPSVTRLDFSYNSITSLPALTNSFTYLVCSYNPLHNLPPLPGSLMAIHCDGDSLTTLPTLPPNLYLLTCGGNELVSLPALPNSITDLECNNNQLSSLPALPASLTYLVCHHNQLTALPTLPAGLKDLYCYNNKVTSLPILPKSLNIVDCSNNLLTSMPPLPDSLAGLYCDQNQITVLPTLPYALGALTCSSNQISELPVFPHSLAVLHCDFNKIQCLPQLPGEVSGLQIDNRIHCLPNPLTVPMYSFIVFDTASHLDLRITNLPVCNSTNNPYNCPTYSIDTVNIKLCLPIANTSLVSNIKSQGSYYWWQVNANDGYGFINLYDYDHNYSGLGTDTLHISDIPSSWYGYQYRCVVDKNSSTVFKLQFADTWKGTVDSVWENPNNWSCGSIPDMDTDVTINSGNVVLSSNTTIRSLTLNQSVSFTIVAPYRLTLTH